MIGWWRCAERFICPLKPIFAEVETSKLASTWMEEFGLEVKTG
jgi:hypothetical protein